MKKILLLMNLMMLMYAYSQAQNPVVTLNHKDVTCHGACNGSMWATVSGGTPPYTYTWSPSAQVTDTAYNLCANTYLVTVTDALGHTTTASGGVNQPAALTGTPSSTNTGCGPCNGTASVSVSGGTPGYSYNWSPAPGGGQGTPNATTLCAGNYTLTVVDANGCSTIVEATVMNTSGPTTSIASQANVQCNGGNTGSATITATGGTAPYTYSWSPSGQTTATVTGLSAGTYTCIVTDAIGCSSIQTVTITQPTPVTLSIVTTNLSCYGGNNGSATATASGGSTSYSYSWNTGMWVPTITGLAAGTYTCTVTDANGCRQTQTVTITQPSILSASAAGINTTCYGSSNGQVIVIPSGGTSPYTYSWSPGGYVTASVTNIPAGSYTVTITDANGCNTTSVATVGQPTILNIVTTTSTSESCVTCCDATALVTPSGGTPGYTFSWSCVPAQYSDTAKQLCAGTYTVCIKDNNGCSVCETVAVAFHTGLAPDPSEIKLQVFPNPANDVLNISFFAGSGQTAKISILSILGTEVYSESVLASGNFHKTIPVQDLPNGLYFIQISAGHTQHTVRFVKN